jgi:carboxypeptidase Taq
MNINYKAYLEIMHKIADLKSASALMNWDQEVFLPSKANELRGQQIATLTGLTHDIFTTKEFGYLLNNLEQDTTLDQYEKANVALTLKDYNREKKYSTAFVIELSKTTSEAYFAWVAARKNNSFQDYAPQLQKLVDLKRKEAELLGYELHPYNAMLDLYEPGLTVNQTTALFESIKLPLREIIAATQKHEAPLNNFMFQKFSKQEQLDLGEKILKNIGYDFEAGRQDESIHPFSISMGSVDARITTHVNENNFYPMMWSSLHEAGHGMYEQGLPMEQYGLPLGEAISLGIHESQSRLWENNVGRSKAFWQHHFDILLNTFPTQFNNQNATSFYKSCNIVKPSLIRIEADELTYHFHIIIRFEIEKALMEGSIEVIDIPKLWKEKYAAYLDIDVPDDINGCLQDIHWSHGSFGYFPTYSFGSLYAAQFYAYAAKAIPNLENKIANGEFKELLAWLRTNIHQYGRLYSADELCNKIGGESLNAKYFIDYATLKFTDVYS